MTVRGRDSVGPGRCWAGQLQPAALAVPEYSGLELQRVPSLVRPNGTAACERYIGNSLIVFGQGAWLTGCSPCRVCVRLAVWYRQGRLLGLFTEEGLSYVERHWRQNTQNGPIDILPALKTGIPAALTGNRFTRPPVSRFGGFLLLAALRSPLTSQANRACPALKILIAPTRSAFSLKPHSTHWNCAWVLRLFPDTWPHSGQVRRVFCGGTATSQPPASHLSTPACSPAGDETRTSPGPEWTCSDRIWPGRSSLAPLPCPPPTWTYSVPANLRYTPSRDFC